LSFSELGLAPELLRAVSAQGYTDPTPVQRQAIPFVLAGRDVLAGAQTGTGKTAAFVLPMLQRLSSADGHATPRNARPRIRALILTPTRELAIQVEQSVRDYGAGRRRSTAIYGGVGMGGQLAALRRGVEIVVATPGRLLDHARQGTIDLRAVEILVLDEADRMLDMGFIRDIRAILALLPGQRQNLLFSATFSKEIQRLAEGLLDRPASVQVTPRNTPTERVRQVVHPVDRTRKRDLLSHLVRTHAIEQALVFTRTKHGANRLAEQLWNDGIATAAIHGNKSQPQRVKALNDFKAGRVTLLIATEVAARGLDIEQLPHVVNFELPMVPADYVHRIGRTGRAGLVGDAVSLVCVDEAPLLRDIERLLGSPIRSEVVAGFEPDRSIPAEPIRLRSGTAAGQGRGSQHSAGRGRPKPRSNGDSRPKSTTRGASRRRDGRSGRRGSGAGVAGSSIGSWVSLPGERRAR
jgi:ATP-dependent RNA helicase RhlE